MDCINRISVSAVAITIGLVVAAQTTISATSVTLFDSANVTSCGNLVHFEVNPGATLDLVMDGDCLGGIISTPVALDKNVGPVSEGSAISIDVSFGSIAQLPVSASVSQPPNLGTASSVGGTLITYFAPPPGTIAAPSVVDTFSYILYDGSGGSDWAQVSVTVVQ